MLPKIGSKVQVWEENGRTLLGWGKIITIARSVQTGEMVPLIMLEGKSQRKIWGDRCNWVTEEMAVKGGIRIFQNIKKGGG